MATSRTPKKDKTKPNTSEAEIYMTDPSGGDITLDIGIGPAGQKATSNVKLDSEMKLHGHDGELKNFVVGTNRQCKNKVLDAATTVVAMDDVKNIDVIYTIKGGSQGKLEIPLWSGPVTKGTNVLFDITVLFF